LNTLIKLFLLITRHLTNVTLDWFDPIRPQDFIIVDQSSALLACDLCGECERLMSDVGKQMAGGAVKWLIAITITTIARFHQFKYHSAIMANHIGVHHAKALPYG
jgi:hypothetical protein